MVATVSFGCDRLKLELDFLVESLAHVKIISYPNKGADSKGNYKQGEKTALRLGETNSKRSNRQRINLKNTQATPPAQLQKNK